MPQGLSPQLLVRQALLQQEELPAHRQLSRQAAQPPPADRAAQAARAVLPTQGAWSARRAQVQPLPGT